MRATPERPRSVQLKRPGGPTIGPSQSWGDRGLAVPRRKFPQEFSPVQRRHPAPRRVLSAPRPQRQVAAVQADTVSGIFAEGGIS